MSEILTTSPVEGDEDRFDRDTPLPEGSPTIHAKHVSVIVTAGTEDRERTIEELQAALDEAVKGIPGIKRILFSSSYYILDGKVCRPSDYDSETQNFKPDTFPPSWAGGPPEKHVPAPKTVVGRSPAEATKKPVKKSQDEKDADAIDDALAKAKDAVLAAKENTDE